MRLALQSLIYEEVDIQTELSEQMRDLKFVAPAQAGGYRADAPVAFVD